MPKFFVKQNQVNNNNITIIGDDVRHIINVLRKNKNDEINICNSDTSDNYIAKIIDFDKNSIKCQIELKTEDNTESNVFITLFQGLPKADKMELIIQKCTEVGVGKIIPVVMKRTVVKVNDKDENKKIERWRKIAEIASKQSMRSKIPEIANIIDLKKLCDELNNFDIILLAYENEKDNTLKKELINLKKIGKLKNKSNKNDYNIGIIIGPEGGLDETEVKKIEKNKKVKRVTLGKRILRTETAGLVMASNILYELEE